MLLSCCKEPINITVWTNLNPSISPIIYFISSSGKVKHKCVCWLPIIMSNRGAITCSHFDNWKTLFCIAKDTSIVIDRDIHQFWCNRINREFFSLTCVSSWTIASGKNKHISVIYSPPSCRGCGQIIQFTDSVYVIKQIMFVDIPCSFLRECSCKSELNSWKNIHCLIVFYNDVFIPDSSCWSIKWTCNNKCSIIQKFDVLKFWTPSS